MAGKCLGEGAAFLITICGFGNRFIGFPSTGVSSDSRRRDKISSPCRSEVAGKSRGETHLVKDARGGRGGEGDGIVLVCGSRELPLKDEARVEYMHVADSPGTRRSGLVGGNGGKGGRGMRCAIDETVAEKCRVVCSDLLIDANVKFILCLVGRGGIDVIVSSRIQYRACLGKYELGIGNHARIDHRGRNFIPRKRSAEIGSRFCRVGDGRKWIIDLCRPIAFVAGKLRSCRNNQERIVR